MAEYEDADAFMLLYFFTAKQYKNRTISSIWVRRWLLDTEPHGLVRDDGKRPVELRTSIKMTSSLVAVWKLIGARLVRILVFLFDDGC